MMSFGRSPSVPVRRATGYGTGVVELDDAELLAGDELLEALRELFASPHYHPPMLPQVALDVHALTKRSDTGLSDVVRVLQRDSMLAAGVLRRAQSPAYATKVAPRTLEDAAARLGMNGLRDLVFEVAMGSRVFRSEVLSAPMDVVRKHSLHIATIARWVAAETAIADDTAFLAGLLHDVGLVAGLHALAELMRTGKRVEPMFAAPVLREVHVDAGVSIVRLWKLPDEMGWIVGAHHDATIQGYVHPVAACIVVAEALATAQFGPVRLGEESLGLTSPAAITAAQRSLSLDARAIERLAERARTLTTD